MTGKVPTSRAEVDAVAGAAVSLPGRPCHRRKSLGRTSQSSGPSLWAMCLWTRLSYSHPFARERFFAAPRCLPGRQISDREVAFDVLDVRQGRWLFKNPISSGWSSSAARVAGGFPGADDTGYTRLRRGGQAALGADASRRPMSLPFYLVEEGTERAFFIDETGPRLRGLAPSLKALVSPSRVLCRDEP